MKKELVIGIGLIFLVSIVAAEERIRIIDYSFIPIEVTIQVGDTVTWVNEANVTRHRVKFTPIGEVGPLLEPGESFSKSFDEEGIYTFQSAAFPARMRGTVKVVEFIPLRPKTYRPGDILCDNCTIVCDGDNCTVVAPSCGDGICTGDENAQNCCMDCPCPAGQECRTMACVALPPAKPKDNKALVVMVVIFLFLAVVYNWWRKMHRGY